MKCLKCFRPRCGYPPLELLVQPLDRIGGAYAAPLARRQPGEGEQAVAGFLQAVGNGAVFEAPLADEDVGCKNRDQPAFGIARFGQDAPSDRADQTTPRPAGRTPRSSGSSPCF